MVKTSTNIFVKQYEEIMEQYEEIMKGANMTPYNYVNYTDYTKPAAVSVACSEEDFKKKVIDTIEEYCKETKEEKKKVEKNVYQIRRRHYGDFTFLDENGYNKRVCIDKVIFNPPATIILWNDKTRTVVKCRDGEEYDKHTGFAMCVVKKLYGPDFHYILNKYGGKTEETEKTEEQAVRMTLDEWRKQVGRVEKAFSSALKSMDKGGNNEL